MRISYPALVASAWLAVAVQSSMAVGFGRVVNVVALGQALDITVTVSADASEQITVDCVAAEVLVGDSPLPSPLLQLRLDPSPDSGVQWLRIHSRVRIVEPVVTVTVTAGCASRVSRQFVVFIDPPLTVAHTSLPTVVESAGVATAVAVLKGAPAISNVSAAIGGAKMQSRKAASRSQRRRVRSPAAVRALAQTPQTAQITEARAARAPSRKPRRVAALPARLRTSASRLQLERGVTLAAVPAMAVAALEAERTQAQQREHIAELQRRLEQSRLDTELSNAVAATLQARLLAAQAPRYSLPWLLALTTTVAVVLFGLGVLLDRRRLAQRSRQSTWRTDRAPTRPAPSTLQPAPSPTLDSARVTAPWAGDDLPEALTRTGPLPFRRAAPPVVVVPAAVSSPSSVVEPPLTEAAVASGNRARAEPVRLALPVTADALIDLEQQAEFFVALGQEDTAADLLDAYSRGAGGACPLPYLLLLDIHHRRGDRLAHTAVGERYGKRFNRSSPMWGGPPAQTTSIADHPEEMRRIESVWSEPLAAMRLVESLLIHGGTPTLAFDLHCLSELRFLYLLARDHSEIEPPRVASAATAPVDLLLPLAASPPSPPQSAATKSATSTVDFELDFMAPASSARSK